MQRHAAKGTEGKEREMVLVSAWKDDHSTLIPGFGFVNIIVLVTIGALSSGGNKIVYIRMTFGVLSRNTQLCGDFLSWYVLELAMRCGVDRAVPSSSDPRVFPPFPVTGNLKPHIV